MFKLFCFSIELGVVGGVSFIVSSGEHFLPSLEVARSLGLSESRLFICRSLDENTDIFRNDKYLLERVGIC